MGARDGCAAGQLSGDRNSFSGDGKPRKIFDQVTHDRGHGGVTLGSPDTRTAVGILGQADGYISLHVALQRRKNFAGRGLEPVRLGVCPLYIECAPEGGNYLQMRARKFLGRVLAGSYWDGRD